jgi:hypothetical protein
MSNDMKRNRIGRIMSKCTDLIASGVRVLSGVLKGTLSLKLLILNISLVLRASIIQEGDLDFE